MGSMDGEIFWKEVKRCSISARLYYCMELLQIQHRMQCKNPVLFSFLWELRGTIFVPFAAPVFHQHLIWSELDFLTYIYIYIFTAIQTAFLLRVLLDNVKCNVSKWTIVSTWEQLLCAPLVFTALLPSWEHISEGNKPTREHSIRSFFQLFTSKLGPGKM